MLPALRPGPSPAALVLAAALPAIFLHQDYQPTVGVPLGGTTADVALTDAAIWLVAAAALLDGRRHGFGRLRRSLPLWVAIGAFLALVLAACFYPLLWHADYPVSERLVTALKFCEYALLAPAAALVTRTAADRRALLWGLALWAGVATLVGVLQFLGLVDEFKGRRPQQREPSWLGIHDFAALSGAALTLAVASILVPRGGRRLAVLGGVAGAVGLMVAAAMDAVGGMYATIAAAWLLVRRRGSVALGRTLALLGIAAIVTLGAVSLRGSAIDAFLGFLGVRSSEQVDEGIQTYAHRTVLAYVGLRIFLDHPVAGAGWQASLDEPIYGPQLPAARERFPDEPEAAFPSPEHPWGVQNGPIQTLSDLGLVGFGLLATCFALAFAAAGRVALRGPPNLVRSALGALGWTLFGLAVFTGSGLLAGIPVDALIWLGFGLSASVAAAMAETAV